MAYPPHVQPRKRPMGPTAMPPSPRRRSQSGTPFMLPPSRASASFTRPSPSLPRPRDLSVPHRPISQRDPVANADGHGRHRMRGGVPDDDVPLAMLVYTKGYSLALRPRASIQPTESVQPTTTSTRNRDRKPSRGNPPGKDRRRPTARHSYPTPPPQSPTSMSVAPSSTETTESRPSLAKRWLSSIHRFSAKTFPENAGAKSTLTNA